MRIVTKTGEMKVRKKKGEGNECCIGQCNLGKTKAAEAKSSIRPLNCPAFPLEDFSLCKEGQWDSRERIRMSCVEPSLPIALYYGRNVKLTHRYTLGVYPQLCELVFSYPKHL